MRVRSQFKSWPASTVAVAVMMMVAAWIMMSLALGARLWNLFGGRAPTSPVQLVDQAMRGLFAPTTGFWVCVVVAAVTPLLLILLAVGWLRPAWGVSRMRGDEVARLGGGRRNTSSLSEPAVRATAERLGVRIDQGTAFGFPIGRAVDDGRTLWTSYEDVCLVIAGPRTGKTTCWVIPRIWAARGFVLATSNKDDIITVTREYRSKLGRVWVFDPQAIVGESQQWWWNILSCVTDAPTAKALTQIFVDTTRDPRAMTNAYFDNAAKDLVAALLLAAARGGLTIMEVYKWLANPDDREPLTILRQHGESTMAQTLDGAMALVAETRSGVYGSAITIVSFMTNDSAMRWVTPQPHLPQLHPADLVRSTDTLYCLSQEGPKSAAPIMTALTVAVTEAAVELATTQPGGRLAVPMLVELDEAANICPWSELPSMYSHFGSRGIVVDTILQSWSQGEARWGKEGLRKLASAANQMLYAGGVKEAAFLGDLEKLIGTYYLDSVQRSHSTQAGSSTSTSLESQQRPIATVSDLAELPKGRAWLLSTGNPPVYTAMVPHYKQRPPVAEYAVSPMADTAAVKQPEPAQNPDLATER